MPRSRVLAFIVHELKQVLPPTIFFAVGFVLIELTTQLILDEYLVRFANFMVAVGAALVVGKAVLVANMLPFLRRFDHAPLIRPILFKTATTGRPGSSEQTPRKRNGCSRAPVRPPESTRG